MKLGDKNVSICYKYNMLNQRKRQQSLNDIRATNKDSRFSQTQKILPTIAEYREAKKTSTVTVQIFQKDLTHVISKFTNISEKQNLKYSEQLVRSSISVIKAFSQTQNNFQTLFLKLYTVLKRFAFAMDDPQIQQLLQVYKVKEGFSFRRTCILMEQQLDNVMKDKNLSLKQMTEKYEKLQTQYQFQKSAWRNQSNFLVSEIEKYKKLADVQYMRSLQVKVESLKNTVSEFELQTKKLSKQNDQYLKEIDFKDNKIHDQAYQIAKIKADLFDAREKIDKSDQYFNKMRDRFDQLLVTMMGLREIIAKVEAENSQLVSQRIKMVNRAAIAFEQLTPRPKYNQILGINFRNGMSTNQIFKTLVEKSEQNKKSVIQISKERRKNQKLQQAQALRSKVVDDIVDAKKQMNKMQKL